VYARQRLSCTLPGGRDTRLPASCRQYAAMPLVPSHLCPSRLPSPRPFALPHAHECAAAALASLLSTMPSSRFPSLLATNSMAPPSGVSSYPGRPSTLLMIRAWPRHPTARTRVLHRAHARWFARPCAAPLGFLAPAYTILFTPFQS
jgi:hypothetical protein